MDESDEGPVALRTRQKSKQKNAWVPWPPKQRKNGSQWPKNKVRQMQLLDEIYHNMSSAGGFSSEANLLAEARKQYGNQVSRKLIKEYLHTQLSHVLHFQRRRRFKRSPMLAFALDDTWQCDLISLPSLKNYNRQKAAILICVDILSGQITGLEPLAHPSSTDVTNAFERILLQHGMRRIPKYVSSDQGKEFSGPFIKLLESKKILYYNLLHTEIKASIVERKIRDVKIKLFRYMTHARTFFYLDQLERLKNGINRVFNRTINMRPIDVTKLNQDKAFKNKYGVFPGEYMKNKRQRKKFSFPVGAFVRVHNSITPSLVRKSYLPTFSRQLYTVKEQIPGNPYNLYRIGLPRSEEFLARTVYSAQLIQQFGPKGKGSKPDSDFIPRKFPARKFPI